MTYDVKMTLNQVQKITQPWVTNHGHMSGQIDLKPIQHKSVGSELSSKLFD